MSKLEFVDEKTFKQRLDDGETDNLGIRKQYTPELKGINKNSRTIDFVISTDAVDRHQDTVSVAGWDFKSYKKNPVVLWAHDGGTPPIGKATSVRRSDGKLKAKAEFTSEELNPFGFMIFNMFSEGFMNAVSVGFVPSAWERASEEEQEDRPWGVDFLKQELLEFSAVPVPANPEALIDARSAGIDTLPMKDWCEQALDQWEARESGIVVPRKQIEVLRKLSDSRVTIATQAMSPEDQDELLKRNLAATKDVDASEIEFEDDVEIVPEPVKGASDATVEKDAIKPVEGLEEVPEKEVSEDSAEKEMEDPETEELAEDEISIEVSEEAPEQKAEAEAVDKISTFDLTEVLASLEDGLAMLDEYYDDGEKSLSRKEKRSLDKTLKLLDTFQKELENVVPVSKEIASAVVESAEKEVVYIFEDDSTDEQDAPEELELTFSEADVMDVMKELLPGIVKDAVTGTLQGQLDRVTGKISD